MIVVADAGPIHYLVLVGAVDALQPLYDRVLVPETVARELSNAKAPEIVRGWIARPPAWCRFGRIHPWTLPCTFSIRAKARRSLSRSRWVPVGS